MVPEIGKDPYPWLDRDDPRRDMTDQEILEKYVDLSHSRFEFSYEKKSLYKVLMKYKEVYFLYEG